MEVTSKKEKPSRLRARKKLQSRFDRRRTLLLLLGLTIFTSLLFWCQTELPLWLARITSPLILTGGVPVAQFEPTPVLAKIKSLTQDLRGVYGVYVFRLADGQEYGLHQEEIFPAASLMKLPVILTLYQEAEAGRLALDTKYLLKDEDKVGGAGVLVGRPAGTAFTYRELASLMGQFSDNTANKILVEILGQKKIQQTIDRLGMKQTSFAQYQTTPADIGLFFQQLWQRGIVTDAHREEILAFLTDTAFEDRLPAGLPEEVRVAHKIGTEIGNFSDAGLIFSQPPFVLVMISKNARETEALAILPQITAAVWAFESTTDK